jgi:hypothetical protein
MKRDGKQTKKPSLEGPRPFHTVVLCHASTWQWMGRHVLVQTACLNPALTTCVHVDPLLARTFRACAGRHVFTSTCSHSRC